MFKTDSTKIVVTNNWANKNASNLFEKEVKIKGDCVVTNFDPDEDNGNKKGLVTLTATNNKISILYGNGSGQDEKERLDLSNNKYAIFTEIAKLYDEDGENKKQSILSIKDVKNIDSMSQEVKDLLGIDKILRDFNAGVVRILDKSGNTMLRIDFKTIWEKIAGHNFVRENSNNNVQEMQEVVTVETDELKDSPKTEAVTAENNSQNIELENAYQKYYDLVPKEYDAYIAKVAKNVGVSETLVRFLIINEGEQGTRKAVLKAYEDKNGVLTIGFGHTNLCNSNCDFTVEKD